MDCPKRSAADGLPEDSWVEILARVPLRCVYRSKCVAKSWRDLIEDPLHAKKIPQTLQGFFSIDNDEGHIGFTSLQARAPLGIDGRLSFLTKLPGFEIPVLADSCNGLLLFEQRPKSAPSDPLGYVVCNPATKHWVSVPRSPYPRGETSYAYLFFDPVVSSHFHIVQFWFEFMLVPTFEGDGEEEELVIREEELYRVSVHVYSSETVTWSHIQSDWEEELGELEEWRQEGFVPRRCCGCALLNGMLHFIVSDQEEYFQQIVVVDVQGETQRIIPLPPIGATGVRKPGYVAQSQGRLHYISDEFDDKLSIWVLEDYDTQKWVLKHSVTFVELFGKTWRSGYINEYEVVAMHPDGNVLFIVQKQKQNLISYDMDHKLVNGIATSAKNISAELIVPYIPCFLESPALTNMH